jgi:hypothetical protein
MSLYATKLRERVAANGGDGSDPGDEVLLAIAGIFDAALAGNEVAAVEAIRRCVDRPYGLVGLTTVVAGLIKGVLLDEPYVDDGVQIARGGRVIGPGGTLAPGRLWAGLAVRAALDSGRDSNRVADLWKQTHWSSREQQLAYIWQLVVFGSPLVESTAAYI